MLTVFTRSLRDFLNFRILMLSFLPILGAALFWGGVFTLFAEQIDAQSEFLGEFKMKGIDASQPVYALAGE